MNRPDVLTNGHANGRHETPRPTPAPTARPDPQLELMAENALLRLLLALPASPDRPLTFTAQRAGLTATLRICPSYLLPKGGAGPATLPARDREILECTVE